MEKDKGHVVTRTAHTVTAVQVERFHVQRQVTATDGSQAGSGVILIDPMVAYGQDVDVVVSDVVVPFGRIRKGFKKKKKKKKVYYLTFCLFVCLSHLCRQ